MSQSPSEFIIGAELGGYGPRVRFLENAGQHGRATKGKALMIAGNSIVSYQNNVVTTGTLEFSTRYGLIHAAAWQLPGVRMDSYQLSTWDQGPLSSTNPVAGVAADSFATVEGSSTITVTSAAHGFTLVGSYAVFFDVEVFNGVDLNAQIFRVASYPTANTITFDCGQRATATGSGGGAYASAWIADGRGADNGNVGVVGSNWGVVGDHIEGLYDFFDNVAQAASVRTSSGAALDYLDNVGAIYIEPGTNNINSANDPRIIQVYLKAFIDRAKVLGVPVIVQTLLGRDFPYSGTLGANPIATTNGSGTVTVTDVDHNLTTGDSVTLTGSSTVAGLTINGTHTVVSTPDGDSWTYSAGSNANATTTGGGSAGAITRAFVSGANTWVATDRRWKSFKLINDWIAAFFAGREREGIYLADIRSVANTVGTYGGAPVGNLRDHVHPGEKMAALVAPVIVPILRKLWADPDTPWFNPNPEAVVLGAYPNDQSASFPPNLIPDSHFAATADGNLVTGVTGATPHLWTCFKTGSAITGVSAVSALVAQSQGHLISPGKATMTVASTTPAASSEAIGYQINMSRYVTTSPAQTAFTYIAGGTKLRITQSSHGAMLGSRCVLTGYDPLAGVNINGSWVVVQVDSSGVFWIDPGVMPSGTATGVGAAPAPGGVTATMLLDATNLLPTGAYLMCGVRIDLPAWAMTKGVRPGIYQRVGSTNKKLSLMRPFDLTRRIWPTAFMEGNWWLTDPVQILDTSSSGCQNLRFQIEYLAEMASGGGSADFVAYEPWLKVVTDPSEFWLNTPDTSDDLFLTNGSTTTFAGLDWTAQHSSAAANDWAIRKTVHNPTTIYRFEIREGDEWPGDAGASPAKERSELSGASVKESYDTDYYSSFAVRYTSPTWDGIRSIRAIIAQLHATTGSSNAIWKIEVLPDGTFNVRTTYDTTADFSNHVEADLYTSTVNLTDGKWHRFVIHWKTTALTTAGVLEIWCDGVKVVNQPSIQMGYLNDSAGPYPKFGAYRQTHSDTVIAEFANYEHGTTDLTGRVTSPLPVPSNY